MSAEKSLTLRWLVVVVVCWSAPHVWAAQPAAHFEQMREVLHENFEAYNHEDVPRMLKTLSPTIPNRQEFARQSEDLFATTDSYISVVEFEPVGIRLPYAVVRVVQRTSTREGSQPGSAEQVAYRAESKLLPGEEESEYIQSFKRENGKWRLWAAMPVETTAMRPSRCANGNCRFPR